MEQEAPGNQSIVDAFFSYLCTLESVLASVGVCLLAIFLVFFSYWSAGTSAQEQKGREAMGLAQGSLDEELRRGVFLAEKAGLRLTEAKGDTSVFSNSRELFLWPAERMSLYDERGKCVSSSGQFESSSPIPMDSRVFELVQKALRGFSSSALIYSDNAVSVAAAAPVRGDSVRAVLIAYPLGVETLQGIKSRTGLDIAVLIPDATPDGSVIATFPDANELLSRRALLSSLGSYSGPVPVDITLSGVKREAFLSKVWGEQNADPSLLVALLHEEHSAFLPHMPGLLPLSGAALAAFAAYILVAYLHFRHQHAHVSLVGSEVARFAREGAVSKKSALPFVLQASLEATAAEIARLKALAGKAEDERDEARRKLNERVPLPIADEEDLHATFFADAASGFFLIQENGVFIEVNRYFATLLGYDSNTQLLSEKRTLSSFCLTQEKGEALLSLLREHSGRSAAVALRKRDGSLCNVSAVSIKVFRESETTCIIAGAITDRVLEERNLLLAERLESDKKRGETLALLLASVCRQMETLPQSEDMLELSAPPDSSSGMPEHLEAFNPFPGNMSFSALVVKRIIPQSSLAVDAVPRMADDLYRFALDEAQSALLPATLMNPVEILEQACLQALPSVYAQDMVLFSEVGNDVPVQVKGVAVLLRHALLRSILDVAGNTRGGRIFLSVARDAERARGGRMEGLIFSASWVAESAFAGTTASSFEGETKQFAASAAPQNGGVSLDAVGGSITDSLGEYREQQLSGSSAENREVLAYLISRMQGLLFEDAFRESSRSVRFFLEFEAENVGTQIQLSEERPEVRENEFVDDIIGNLSLDSCGLFHEKTENLLPDDPFEGGLHVGTSGIMEKESSAGEGQSAPYEEVAVGSTPPPVNGEVLNEVLDILLIDDSLNNRLLFSMFLRDTKHRITEAHNGQQGIEAFQNQKFDVIFMDMEMPLMNGYQVTRIIRAIEADASRKSTPIVAQSAHILPDFRYQCLLAGCTEFLPKPYTKNALLTLVHAFATMKQAEKNSPV